MGISITDSSKAIDSMEKDNTSGKTRLITMEHLKRG
jgi:hypothetical protein